MAYIGGKAFIIMGSLTGKISKGILGDFIFKAAVWRTGCFKSSVPGNQDSLHDSRSSFKSVTSLLVGIAIDRGLIKGVNQKVYEFFPQYPAF